MDLPPPYIQHLFKRTEGYPHKTFHDNATQLNNLLSFATVQMKNGLHGGVPSIKVHGTVFATIRPSILEEYNFNKNDYDAYFHVHEDDLELKEDAKELLKLLDNYLKYHNYFHRSIYSVASTDSLNLATAPLYSLKFSNVITGYHRGTTNAPSSSTTMVGLIFNLPENEIVGNREIILNLKGNTPGATIPLKSTNSFYDPLSYILYYPYGGTGYSEDLKDVANRKITLKKYYNYRIQVRESRRQASFTIGQDVLLYGGKLSLRFW